MTKTEALAKIEELQKYVDSIQEEPQTEPRDGQRYWTLTFKGGGWTACDCTWGAYPSFDRARLKSGTCFWQGTEAEQEAEAQRAILRCRYALENQWKPKQGQEVWCWDAYGGVGNSTFNWNLKGMVRSLNEGFYSPSKEEAEKRRDEFLSAFVPEGVK